MWELSSRDLKRVAKILVYTLSTQEVDFAGHAVPYNYLWGQLHCDFHLQAVAKLDPY